MAWASVAALGVGLWLAWLGAASAAGGGPAEGAQARASRSAPDVPCFRSAHDGPPLEAALAGRRGPATAHSLADESRGASPEVPRQIPGLRARLALPGAPSAPRFARRRPVVRRCSVPEAGLVAHLSQGPPRHGRAG